MPCWQVNTYSVEFDPKNRGLLDQAARSLGGQVVDRAGVLSVDLPESGRTIVIENGKATGPQAQVNALRVAYSQAAVAQAAAWAGQKGWAVQRQGANKLTLSK